MSNFSYDDFAVLVRTFSQNMLSSESLRIVPLSVAPSMADAIKGTNLTGIESELNLPRDKNGRDAVKSNVTVQHDSAGYCRLVGHIEAVKPQDGQGGQEGQVTTAKAFVLYRTVTDASDNSSKKEVIAVASLKEGFAIGDVCYPSFTITTVNNYQSVAFNPNAFATVEDLKNINGLDGLHIAFDTASGDLKLLDKDGNVLDQANLPIKADVIIAEGEEGYKYVKTDVKQNIHAAKAWMPEGSTAWDPVPEAPYRMSHAALVVGSSDGVLGITTDGTTLYTFDEGAQSPAKITSSSGGEVRWLDTKEIPEGSTLKYGLEAFVWTVKDRKVKLNEPFFQQLNASLLALGFHEGDDIALGTNIGALSGENNPLNGVDADDYMHGETENELGETNKELREKEVDDQRKFAQDELKAWNAQHPAFDHDGLSGTRISSNGVDIRKGKILIGDGNGLGNDAVKHYELSTNFSSDSASQPDQGLAFSAVTDESSGNLVNSNVLTISRYGYISGAPICMAMAEITEQEGAIEFALIRRTSCFGCNITEAEGTVTITITDNRLNSAGFSGACIVEISPVYISAPSETSETSAHETLPALNMVNTVAESVSDNPTQLTCTCPQIIDWANSVNISSGSGARMFVIVKVY